MAAKGYWKSPGGQTIHAEEAKLGLVAGTLQSRG